MPDYQFDTSGKLNALNAAIQSFADTATFGLAPKASAKLASVMYGVPYQTALDAETQYQSQLAGEHPIASTAGTVGGIVANPVGDVGGATKLARAGRNALLGGGAAAANDVAETGEVGGHTVLATGVGALGGAIAGPVGEYAAGKAQVAGNAIKRGITALTGKEIGVPNLNAWRTVAKRVGVSADDLLARYGQYVQDTQGKVPALGQLFTPDEAAKLRSVASRAPGLGQDMRTAAKAAPGLDASADEIATTTRTAMDRVMSAPGANGQPMRDQAVEIPDTLMQDPDFLDALRHPSSRPIMREMQRGFQATGVPTIPLKQADALRQTLNDLHQNAPSGRYKDMREALVSDIDRQVPGYSTVVQNFGEGQQAAGGFKAGMVGQGPSQTGPMTRPEQMGFDAGRATKAGQESLENAAPSQTASERNMTPTVTEIGLGLAHIGHGSPFLGMAHVLNGSRVLTGGNLGPGAQSALAAGLLSRDPAVVQRTLARLQSAEQSVATSRRVGGNVAANAGQTIGTQPGVTGVPDATPAPVDTGLTYARPKVTKPAAAAGKSDSGFYYAKPRKTQ